MKYVIALFYFATICLSSCDTQKKEPGAETNTMSDKKEEKTENKDMVNPDTKAKMEAYFKSHDTAYVAEDAVFHNMSTGEETKGKAAIAGMLHYIYHVAFDAHADVQHTMVTDKHAVLEATFKGKHIGEFAGMKATNKEVKVPLCVTYDLNDEGLIKEARIYMLGDVMMKQLRD